MTRPTVHDIAREAGVSLATVDRVLNARTGVREKTIARVHEAVRRLGYVRDTHAANLARQRQYRFAIVLPEGPSQFTATLRAALHEAEGSPGFDRTVVTTVFVPQNNPHAVVRALRSLQSSKIDGVAIMTPETPQVRDAIARLKADGIAVVALVSDLPNSARDHFVGINNVAAGRTAGMLMGKFIRGGGEVLAVTNSMRARDSLERRLGFDAVMAQDFPELRVLPSVESFDDPERMRDVVREVLVARPRIVGVYSMGLGNAKVLEALRQSGRILDLVTIAHELTPTTRQALIDSEIAAVITQNVGHLIRSTLRILRAVRDAAPIYESQERIRIEVVLRENLP